jgi:hypothetical protein
MPRWSRSDYSCTIAVINGALLGQKWGMSEAIVLWNADYPAAVLPDSHLFQQCFTEIVYKGIAYAAAKRFVP